MRAPLVLLLAAAAGMLAGGALIGVWALGLALMIDSAAVAVFAVVHDWPERKPAVHVVPGGALTLAEVLEKARAA